MSISLKYIVYIYKNVLEIECLYNLILLCNQKVKAVQFQYANSCQKIIILTFVMRSMLSSLLAGTLARKLLVLTHSLSCRVGPDTGAVSRPGNSGESSGLPEHGISRVCS